MRRFFCFVLFLLSCSGIQAQEVTVTRKVVGSPGPNLFYVNPSLALNEKTQIALLVWEKHPGNHPDHSTLSRKISPSGVLKGSVKTLINGTNTYHPQLVYNSNENEFALVYADEFRNPVHTIFVQRLDASGRKQGDPVQISTDSGSSFVNQNPFATFHVSSNRYIVVWSRNSTQPNSTISGEGLYAAALDENLNTVDGPTLIRPERVTPVIENPQVRNIALNRSGKILVVFTETVAVNPNKSDYHVASFDADLTNLNVSKLNKIPTASVSLAAAFANLPSNDFVFFSYHNGALRKRRLDATGKPVGAITAAFPAPLKSRAFISPAFVETNLAATGDPAGLLAGIEEPSPSAENGNIWIQRIDSAGKPIGAPESVETNFLSASDVEILKLPFSTAKLLRFSLVYVNGGQVTVPPQGESSELIHLKITLPVR